MKMIDLTCQKCGGNLKADIDNLYAFCPHCGQKLLFDLEQIEFVLAEREKTKREQEKTKREQEVTKRAKLDHEYKEKHNHSEFIRSTCRAAIMFFMILAFMYFCEHFL